MATSKEVDSITEQLSTAFSSTEYACSSLERLTGGTANFVYRGTLAKPVSGASSIIIKHTEPYIALNPAWKLEVSRCDYENLMLKALSHMPPTKYQKFQVKAPSIIQVETLVHTQVLEDLNPCLTLKDYLIRHGPDLQQDVARSLGFALGTWLISMHEWAMLGTPEVTKLRAQIAGNQAMKQLKYDINIGRYTPAIDKFPEIKWAKSEVYNEIAESIKKAMADEGSLVHGDFWTGNILLQESPLSNEQASDIVNVFVVDFEFSHIGNRAQDLGQCFAELYLIAHFRGILAASQIITDLSEGYCKERRGGKDDALAFQVAMHVGIHLVNWPWRVGNFPMGPLMVECVEFGDQLLLRGYRKDRDWFRGGILDALFAS